MAQNNNYVDWEKPLSKYSDEELDHPLARTAPPAELAKVSDEQIDQWLSAYEAQREILTSTICQ